jgi:hypothetical protein
MLDEATTLYYVLAGCRTEILARQFLPVVSGATSMSVLGMFLLRATLSMARYYLFLILAKNTGAGLS